MSSAGLEVKNLQKNYAGEIQALAGIDLHIASGLYGLLGPNGAGKSTLMRTLATLQPADSGGIHLDGVDVQADPDYLRARLGYLPQQIGAYPGISARGLMDRLAWLKGRTDKRQRRAEIEQLLERVNLVNDADRQVVTFSGGMLRRFGIAVALIGSPRLLIVDEPTAGLDPAERNRFHRILADIGSEAIVLLSTHIVEDIENLCTQLSILQNGKIVAEGTPETLKQSLQGKLWEREIPRSQKIPAEALHVTATPHGNRIVVAGAQLEGFVACQPRLEDVYHHALQVSVNKQA